MKISELEDGHFYLVKLKSHLGFAPPRLTKQELIEKVQKLEWKEEDIEIESADLPYANRFIKK